jgi:hypothetical protein
MGHDMLHHAELNLELKTLEKRNRKAIRKFRKKEKPFWPKPARPRVARLPPLTGRSRLSTAVCPALPSLPLARCPVGPGCRCGFSLSVPLSPLCLVGPRCQSLNRYPHAPVLSLYVVGLPCQLRPPRAHRGPARALAHIARILGHITMPTPSPF